MTSTCPADLYSTPGTGSGSGSAAAAMRAAIFGVACLASRDQAAASRRFTKRSSALEPAWSASSLKSGASCVQPTRSSASPSAFWNCAACRRQSSVCTVSGASSCNAFASALASIAAVLLQLQTCSFRPLSGVLLGLDIFLFHRLLFHRRLGRRRRRLRLLLFGLRDEKGAPSVFQLREERLGHRLGLGVVVDVGIQAIHHVEARIGEE